MWSTENSRFCEKHIEKQPKTSQNGLFSAVFWSKWQDSNLRSHRPERCAIPPSLHLDVVKIFDFFVSGQTWGQTEDLMIFRHSGEPKKSVFSRVFGSSRNLYAENGDWDPKLARYHLRYASKKYKNNNKGSTLARYLRHRRIVVLYRLRKSAALTTPCFGRFRIEKTTVGCFVLATFATPWRCWFLCLDFPNACYYTTSFCVCQLFGIK